MTVIGSFFNITTIATVVVYALSIASIVMITVSLIRSAQAQRSIARSLEHIEKLLQDQP